MSELKAGVLVTPHNEGMCFHRSSAVIAATEGETEFYLKSEADKFIEDLEESHKREVEKLKADYKEACDRLQTANLIKDEQLAATRHQKYKRCIACKNEWNSRSVRFQNLWEKWRKNEGDTSGSFYRNYIKCWHRAMKWLSLAELYKEASK